MARVPASIYLDEDVSVVVAAILRARGCDAMSARDTGQLGRSDSEQLAFGAAAGRVVLTHNRIHFERLHRDWLQEGRSHAGILVARRRPPRDVAARVGRLLARLGAADLKDQLFYV